MFPGDIKALVWLLFGTYIATTVPVTPVSSIPGETKRLALLDKPIEPSSDIEEEISQAEMLARIEKLEQELVEEKLFRLEEVGALYSRISVQENKLQELDERLTTSLAEGPRQYLPAQLVGPIPDLTKTGHIVRRGETLSEISSNYGVTVDALSSANKLQSANLIIEGQRLVIPRGGTVVPVAESDAIQTLQSKIQQTQLSAPDQPRQVLAQAPPRQQSSSVPEVVGERPSEEYREPTVNLLSDVGGILSAKGAFYLEPQINLSTSSDNRFFFNGVEIVDSLLIGIINATDTDRTSATFSQGFRYGMTNRIELDASVPFVAQENRVSGVQIDGQNSALQNLNNSGIGDVTAGVHLQLNEGKKFPYTIANLRVKAPSGEGPFDIDQASETPTGSGYWTIEPSMTFIQPADPAVLFANVGYQYNMKQNINRFVGGEDTPRSFFRTSDPGDAIRTSFGIGLSLNEDLSLNFGYDQSYIFSSRLKISAEEQISEESPVLDSEGQAVTIGSLLFGISYNPVEKLGISLNTTIGATDEAPDATVSLKARYRLLE